ncbi:MAG: leucine-rich repeat domain-containing protein, partial [Ruminococcus sp.]
FAMTKLLSIILVGTILISMFSMISVSAETDSDNQNINILQTATEPTVTTDKNNTYNDFVYKVYDKAVTITKYIGNERTVKIPTTIDGKPVTVIGKAAFLGNENLEQINIGDNVASIEGRAFEECTKLNKVTFGDSVKKIGNYAFFNCKNLKSITLPLLLKRINEGVFFNTGLKSIYLPSKINSINNVAFWIDSLKEITVSKNNKSFSSVSGILYNKKQTKLLICPRNIKVKKLTIPKTVRSIDDSAFSNNKTIKSITLPNGLKNIGMIAFLNCKKLKCVTIPKSVSDIEESAFVKPMKLKVYKNSVAHKYAKEYNLKFTVIG